jgi:hypothetical protein
MYAVEGIEKFPRTDTFLNDALGPDDPPPNNVPFTVRFMIDTFTKDAFFEEKFPGITTVSELLPNII